VTFRRSDIQPQALRAGRTERGRRKWPRAAHGILTIGILAGGFLSGCRFESLTPTAPQPPTVSPTAELPLASLLPTLDGAATEELEPTATPTMVVTRPAGAGERIFYDPLDDNRFGWTLPKTGGGSVAFLNGLLVFTVGTPFTALSSTLPKEIPPDVYIEVTVQTIICGAGVDTFGIIFRNQGDSSYRYVVTCRGQLRMERYAGEGMEAASAWKDTIGLLQGAPAANRIGLLLQGSIFRFFVNGAEVYSRSDTVSASGGVGLFDKSEKSQMLSVGFDDLAIYTLSSSPE
jgi:hypothetical protein